MRSIAERLTASRRNKKELNPSLFDEDMKLHSIVKDKIEKIVEEFLEYIQVDIKVLDIRLVGSNASYNYTPESDLDIHIVTDLSSISDPEIIARLYFDSAKKNFKDSYDIKIKGIEVEMYIEDVNTSSVSNGVYSVSKDEWIKEPTPTVEPTEKQVEEAEKFEHDILYDIKQAGDDPKKLQDVIDDLYLLRKDSLSAEGETAPGNLAFKSLRNKGVLDKIKDILHDATSKELSLESKELKKKGF